MICSQCGANNSDEDIFCQKCGKGLETTGQNESTLLSPPPVPASPYENFSYIYPGSSEPNYPPPPPPQYRTRFSLVVGIVSGIAVSILILGSVGVFVLLTQKAKNTSTVPTTIPSEKCSGAFSDEFNSSLHSRWSWINPSGNATYSVTAQVLLSISAPPNSDLYPTDNLNAPRLLQPISGNFTVETLVDFNPIYSYQGAGILIWQDDAKFLRFERGYNNGQNGIVFQKDDNGLFSNVSSLEQHPTQATRIELRVQRNGDHVTASWRVPGQDWQIDGETDIHFDSPMVGLDLIAALSAPQTTANYDYFRVTCT
jgi:regulation of enolase protein 1 (concanavalin A-like superfamily)